MKGTWQGSGTFQTGGSSAGPILIVAAIVILAGSGAAAAIASALVTVLVIVAGVVVAALAVTVFLIWRVSGRRDLMVIHDQPAVPAGERETVTATVIPQVSQEAPPAIAPTLVLNFYGADSGDMAARVIRTALPGNAESAITEGES